MYMFINLNPIKLFIRCHRQSIYLRCAANIHITQSKSKKKDKFDDKHIRRALKYFDSVYSNVYEKQWDEMRTCLQKEPNYVAMLNSFVDANSIEEELLNMCTYDIGSHYNKNIHTVTRSSNTEYKDEKLIVSGDVLPEIEKSKPPDNSILVDDGSVHGILRESPELLSQRLVKSEMVNTYQGSSFFEHIPATELKSSEDWVEETDSLRDLNFTSTEVSKILEDSPIVWPDTLKIFGCIRGETVEFPAPRFSHSNPVFTHYLFNGSSVLPVLALDVQLGDLVLDMCSGPGGKAIAIMQTMKPGLLVCNDISSSRLNRVKRSFEKFIPEELSVWDSLEFSKSDGCNALRENYFDKVLVDAPCLNDRVSVQENDNSIFKSGRTLERLKMPELQAALIVSAIKSVKPGGSVVYSTCTLSPLQNDGAVHLALSRIWKETKIKVNVVNMDRTMKNLRFFLSFGRKIGLRYGYIVVPRQDDNYGPMYVCKMTRKS